MPCHLDPEGNEIQYLHGIAPLPNAAVLEIGCGDGRLISRYAASARHVVGVEPRTAPLALAMRRLPPTPSTRVSFAQANAEALPFRSGVFDVAILAWSL
jgi:ubiquinone/menaquinone biosynthesis C-methylase UbiE